MRATMRITWLLLSLSFLFHSVCSNDENATSVTKNAASVTAVPSVVLAGGNESKTAMPETVATALGTTGTPPTGDAGKKNELTQAPTTARPTAAVTTPATAVTAPHKTTDKPATVQPQAPTVNNNPPAPSTTISGAAPAVVNEATPGAAMPSQLQTVAPTDSPPTNSGGSSVVAPSVTTIQTPEASVPSKTSGTDAPVELPGVPGHVGTTKITKVSTDSPTPGLQSVTHTTITSKIDQENSKGGTEETVTVTSHKQTASKAPEPAGSTGTTSTPSALTEAGPPATETSGTKAGTTPLQTTATTTTAPDQRKTFLYSLNNGHKIHHQKEEKKDLVEVCRRLMTNLQDGNCTITWWDHNGKIQFDCVEINGNVKTSLAAQYYEEITKKPTDNKTLIAILASCGALLIMIVILAVCASHHRKPYNENQQHLTEELHTVENGYHDNPTLEVMEVQPEMQEKKMALNGEFNDSWIVPIDNLPKEDIPDEEDTHL